MTSIKTFANKHTIPLIIAISKVSLLRSHKAGYSQRHKTHYEPGFDQTSTTQATLKLFKGYNY